MHGYSGHGWCGTGIFALACNGFYYACTLLALVGSGGAHGGERGPLSPFSFQSFYTVGLHSGAASG